MPDCDVLAEWCSNGSPHFLCLKKKATETWEQFAHRAGKRLEEEILAHPVTNDCP